MTAILSGAISSFNLGSGGASSYSGAVVVPAGTTRLVIMPAFYNPYKSTSSATFNSVSLTKIAGSANPNAASTGPFIEAWQLASPSTGSHTLALTLSGTARGGGLIFFVKGDTGVGAVNGQDQGLAILSPKAADASLVLFGSMIGSGVAGDGASGAFANSSLAVALTAAGLLIGHTMRGYPQDPAILMNSPSASAGCAVEILS